MSPSTTPMEEEDVYHDNPHDNHEWHVWFFEPPTKKGVLTTDGITQIQQHKYKAGSYTYLDTFLSANLWQPLTDNLLPMWLAPNLVTTLGGCFCLTTFVLASIFCHDETVSPPNWLFFSNGFCMFVYYTMDCMDGKQARRTNSSSPLGQLFDHGMDCICNLAHLQLVQCIFLLPPHVLLLIQTSLQFTFWQAQWEEYYTGTLPHATGNWVGVTEVNYGMALWSIMASIFGREAYDTPLLSPEQDANLRESVPLLQWFLAGSEEGTYVPFQTRHLMVLCWAGMLGGLVTLSWIRVYKYNPKIFPSAMSKMLSPLLLCIVGLWGLVDRLSHSAHSGSLSLGLCFCLITVKIIVYSMAKMAYASIQIDIVPLVLVVAACRIYDIDNAIVFILLDVFYLVRLLYWARVAISQLCERLQIELFRIPAPPAKKQE